MSEVFLNEKRERYYGLRVGDIVCESAFGLTIEGEVVELSMMDNNRVWVQKADGKVVKCVAEWCTIIKKVEEK